MVKTMLKVIGALALAGGIFVAGLVTGLNMREPSEVVDYVDYPTRVDYFDYPTGSEVLLAINRYRAEAGLSELEVSPEICNNLVKRFQAVNQSRSHEGFQEWVDEVAGRSSLETFSEIFVYDPQLTPEKAIAMWRSSPGHALILENPESDFICVHAEGGAALAVTAYE